ncbi:MAG: transporter [Mameliella sp.]|nr:transporter [Mameliella sp.]
MVLLTIWPLFALICLGHVLARTGFPDPGFWPAAERINYFILFPALLVSSLVDAPIGDPQILRLGAAAVTTLLVAAFGMAVARCVFPTPSARFGPALQGVVRFNTFLGLAVTASLAGAEGMERAAVYLAVCVPVVNVVSIIALSERDVLRRPGALLRMILFNPMILGCLFGISLALLGLGLPFGTGTFLELLARGSLPLGLLCVGAALQPSALRQDIGPVVGNAVLRLLGMPVLAALIGLAYGLDGAEALVLVVFSAIPTAPAAYVLTRQLNGDGTFMAGLVTAQTMAALVTIPLVLLVLGLG